MQPVYILSSCAISPQQSFEPGDFLKEAGTSTDGKLFVIDADYRQFINPVAIRRMSRQMKMGISTAMRALQLAGIEKPDAIITGTGLGSMTDMEHFLKDMIQLEEQALNPTYFIQSTYNSINGWISLQTKSTGYNQTYVHRGLSLELALLDAQLLLSEEQSSATALVGCFDELTPDYFIVKSKCGYWKKELPDSLSLLNQHHTPGSIAGEGAAFFTLSNTPENATGILKGVQALQDVSQINKAIEQLLTENGLSAGDIDLVLTGMSGDVRFQGIYDASLPIFTTAAIGAFKHLTGEYPTTSGFALWLAIHILQTGQIPEPVLRKPARGNNFRNAIIINHYVLGTGSVMLVAAIDK